MIIVTVLLVTMTSAYNDYSKDKQFRALNKEKDNIQCKASRGGFVACLAMLRRSAPRCRACARAGQPAVGGGSAGHLFGLALKWHTHCVHAAAATG